MDSRLAASRRPGMTTKEEGIDVSDNQLDVQAVTDQPTTDIVKQQLAGFEKFVRRLNGRK
jgi:hypothetical protein